LVRAQELFQQALDIDPKFTVAMAMLGGTYQIQADSGWTPDPKESYRKVVDLSREAIAIDPSFGDAYAGMANALLGLGQYSEATAAAEKALALSPNHADTLALSGWVFALNGRAEQAVSLAERALRRNPFPPEWYFGGLGDSLLFANRAEEALAAHRKCVDRIPDFIWCQLGLTVDYVEAGKLEQAAAQARELVRINPNITAQDNTYVRSIGVPADRRRVIEALRKAGLN
jgi:adenylate cyclase